MKKLKLLLLSLLFVPLFVQAASGNIKITGGNTVVVGNKVTVTVTLSSNTNIGSWQIYLNYDKGKLQLASSSAEAGGTVMANSSSGIKNKKYTYTFKTLKTGNASISISSYLVYDYDDMNEMNITVTNKTIRIITQQELEASYSKDNYLKSLKVEGFEITPEFNKDVLEYSLIVPEDTKEVNINAIVNDNKSNIRGNGVQTVTEGINNFEVIVKAQNGAERIYKLAIEVKDQNPINVEIDGKQYIVVKLRENYKCPDLFEESEININNFNIPSCVNKNINYTLVGLKNGDNNIESYVYENGKYHKYIELTGTYLKIISQKYDGQLTGFVKSTVKLNNTTYEVFKHDKSDRFYVIYGLNVENGEKDLYIYDTKNKTFSVYDQELINDLKDQNKIYLLVILVFGIGCFLSIICNITLFSKKKKHSKIKSKKVKKEKD